jgi:DNA invertase Pin-like site-specific DNA recombinase
MAAARALPKPAQRIAIGIKRVSLLKQVGNYSFDGQGNKFAMLADQWGCTIPAELMIEDQGYSGTDFNRPSIKKAQSMIRAGVANAVAFPWVDRFARDVEGGLATIRQFVELGADVLLGDLGWYTNAGHFRFQMNIFLSVAQYQRDDIADKSRYGVQAKLAKGLAHFGAPYGWHMVTAREIAARALVKKQPVPPGKPQNFYERVLEDLDTVRLMGEMALAGGKEGSQRGIARELDARGILTPKFRRVGWTPTTTAAIMRDEVYSTGVWYYGKREFVEPEKFRLPEAERHRVRSVSKFKPREEWAGSIAMPGGAIWTPDEQGAILEALERNGRTSVGKPARPRSEGGREALLKTLCVCGATVKEGERQGKECGRSIQPTQSDRVKNDGTRSMWYRCTHRHKTQGHHLCDYTAIKAELLEEAVWQGTRKAVCEDLDALVAAHFKGVTTREDEAALASLRAEHNKKTAMRREAMRLQIEAQDSDDKKEYAGLVSRYKAELALLDRRIQTAASENESEHMDTATVQRQARKAFQTEDPAERRAVLLDWVHEVRYAHGWATITVSVQIGANCKSAEQDTGNKHLLLNTKIRVAAA